MNNNNILRNYIIDDNISIQTEEIDRGLILRLSGQLDFNNAWPFLERINRCVEYGHIILFFDCSEVNYISSSGIGVLVSIEKELSTRNGTMLLVGVQQKIFDLFDLLGFRDHFAYRNTMEEVIEEFYGDTHGTDGDEINKNSPLIFRCPVCVKKQRTDQSGRFRCGFCRSLIEVDANGGVFWVR